MSKKSFGRSRGNSDPILKHFGFIKTGRFYVSMSNVFSKDYKATEPGQMHVEGVLPDFTSFLAVEIDDRFVAINKQRILSYKKYPDFSGVRCINDDIVNVCAEYREKIDHINLDTQFYLKNKDESGGQKLF